MIWSLGENSEKKLNYGSIYGNIIQIYQYFRHEPEVTNKCPGYVLYVSCIKIVKILSSDPDSSIFGVEGNSCEVISEPIHLE